LQNPPTKIQKYFEKCKRNVRFYAIKNAKSEKFGRKGELRVQKFANMQKKTYLCSRKNF